MLDMWTAQFEVAEMGHDYERMEFAHWVITHDLMNDIPL